MSGLLDSRRELHALLLRVEEAHRADILTYSSGHLNPDRLSKKAPNRATTEPKWIRSSSPEKNVELQHRARMQPEGERMKKGPANATVPAAPVTPSYPRLEKWRKQPCHLQDPTQMPLVRTSRSTETGLASRGPEEQHILAESPIMGVIGKDRLQRRKEFESPVLNMRNLREPNGLDWSKAAMRQDRRWEQALRELCTRPQQGRERLRFFRNLFAEVCEGSHVLGQILREIKTEYELYLNFVLSYQPNIEGLEQRDPEATTAVDLVQARDEVLRLENDARKALENNDQARMELKRERDQVQQINGEQMQVEQQDLKQGRVLVSPSDQVLHKRRQVWTALEEIRLVENEIRKEMAPKDASRATDRYIRDLEAEITALSTANKGLCEANEDLQRNISLLLKKEKVTDEIQEEIWGRRFGTTRHTKTKILLNQ